MGNAKGTTEITIRLASGSVVTITADASTSLQAVFFDPAAAIAAGIPSGPAPSSGVRMSVTPAVHPGGATTTDAMTAQTSDTVVCYMVNGVLVCPPPGA